MGEVGSRTERGRRARDDHRAHVRIVLHAIEGGDDLVDEVEREHVAPVGVVEGDDCHALVDVDAEEAQSGVRTTAGEWRKNVSTSVSYLYAGRLSPTVCRRCMARA